LPNRGSAHRIGVMRTSGVRGPVLIAWSAFALTGVMAVVTAAFGVIDDGTSIPEDNGVTVGGAGEVLFSLMFLVFAAIGAVLASRRPRNQVAWILCVAPLFLGYTGVARGWYVHTVYADPGSLPLSDLLMWAANWAWIPGFPPLLTLLPLLFPEGRPVTARWRPVGWLCVLAMTSLVLGYAFAPGPLEDYPRVVNPLGLEGADGDVAQMLLNIGFPLLTLAAILSLASLVVRFRRSSGIERQQVKWMAAAAALVVFAWMLNNVLDQGFGINSSFMLPLVLLAMPAATAVAVLRYRLYDLGLVVNRALVYGALTATLIASYLGCVLLLQLALGPVTEDNGLAIAGSTLAAAALFRPARERIQAIVDRRFYRRRYDAAQTVESFSARLRDEVELDALTDDLRGVVADTMQPAHVSLWLRSEAGR
jgi:hypothetical protein